MACPWDDLHCGPGVTVQKSATGWNRWRTLACSYCSSTAGVSAVGTHSFVSGVYEWALVSVFSGENFISSLYFGGDKYSVSRLSDC